MKNKKWWQPERSKRRPSDKLFAVVEEVLENPEDYESLTKSRPIKIAKEFLNDVVDLDDVLFVFESLGFDPEIVTLDDETFLVKVIDNHEIYIVESCKIEEDYGADVKLAADWLADLDESKLEDYSQYNSVDFWSVIEPGMIFYHGAPDERWPLIDMEGLQARCETRGLHNKYIGDAVFVTPHVYEADRYGDVIEIDVWKMLQDGYTPQTALEENVNENNMRKIIADKIGLDVDFSSEYYSLGVDPDTIVIFGDIPRKYLRLEGYDT